MDYPKVLLKYYADVGWNSGETYESIEWKDKTEPKPTEEELNLKWEELKKDNMRQERNQLLKDCDFRVLSDYPNTNIEAWVSYRKDLRDFPALWSEGMDYPIKPE
jgi:hypothetical protein